MIKASRKDGSHHDFSLVFDKGRFGLTIHSNFKNPVSAKQQLIDHCNRRKYSSKAKTWFGLFLDPRSGQVRFGINLEFDWVRSDELEKQSKTLKKPFKWTPKIRANFKTKTRNQRKIGRNEGCPCGSGKKYKKCCIN
jgi:hypothetical protein